MKYLKLFENIGDDMNSKSKNIDVVLIPSGEVLSVNKNKLFTIFDYDPEFEVYVDENLQKFVLADELKEEFLKLLEFSEDDWYNL